MTGAEVSKVIAAAALVPRVWVMDLSQASIPSFSVLRQAAAGDDAWDVEMSRNSSGVAALR